MYFITKKALKTIGGIIVIIVGWLSLGIGITIKNSFNGVFFYSGFVLIIAGIILLAKNKKQQ